VYLPDRANCCKLLQTIPVSPQDISPAIELCDIPPVAIIFIDLSKLCPPVKSELNSIGLTFAWALPADLEEDLPPPPLLSDLLSDLDSPEELSEELDSELLLDSEELDELSELLEELLDELAAEPPAALEAALEAAELAAEELAEEAALDAAALTAEDTADAVT
jgi:hypothetical protein